MYYPCLENLRRAKFPNQSIELLDWWLGTRRQNTKKSINPLQFSLDCEIDIEHTLRLFSKCTYDPQIKLFKKRYVTYCPYCDHRIRTSSEELEHTPLQCSNCGMSISNDIIIHQTELLFEIIRPQSGQEPEYEFPSIIKSPSEKKLQAFGCLI